ncbi:anti-sigma factor family protein [Geomicrobium sediminis]|uniref:Anti-sigma-W factor RsiW n=1 Tax=Geomicrobium sediminis TaxID=1347788 RepID=A0ABS2PGA3_9BACL|nr:anti-sigma factor [Geomicrobium sediminis]MBM7634307.1 anti-sigma factor (TIGR02949 family) [Geomicrobium sediminis]
MSCLKHSDSIHRYFDGEMTQIEREQLYRHLEGCSECQEHYDEVKKSIALVQSASHIQAPKNFTENVMSALPQKKKKRTIAWKKWSKNHPVLVAAAVFLLFMSSMTWLNWTGMSGGEMAISGVGNFEVDQENNTVIIPEGEVIEGDLTVRNGDVDVQGEVHGDLTVINGEQYMASAGQVAGNIEEVNQVLSWLWYETKELFSNLSPDQED